MSNNDAISGSTAKGTINGGAEPMFPLHALPTHLRDPLTQFASATGLTLGAAVMGFLSFLGGAVGARVTVHCGSRRHHLGLPVTIVAAPGDELLDGFNALAAVFTEESRRLQRLNDTTPDRPAMVRQYEEFLRSPEALEARPKDLQQIRRHLREFSAMTHHKLLVVDGAGETNDVYDEHQVLYGRGKSWFTGYLAADKRGRTGFARYLAKGFFTPDPDVPRLSPLFVVTPALLSGVLQSWREGGASWPTLFLSSNEVAGGVVATNGLTGSLPLLREAIARQLLLRIESEPCVFTVGDCSYDGVQQIRTRLAELAVDVLLPEAYLHFIQIFARLAGILHVVQLEPGAEITLDTYSYAADLTLWLLEHHHHVVTPPHRSLTVEGAALPQRERRYAAPGADDEGNFLKHLARRQPVRWRDLSPFLPKRPPGYWRRIKNMLMVNQFVREDGRRLSVTRFAAEIQ